MRTYIALLLIIPLLAVSAKAQTASLKMRFVADTEERKHQPANQKEVDGLQSESSGQSLVIDANTKGIKNLVVYTVPDRDFEVPKRQSKPVNHTVTLTPQMELTPRVTIARTGDSLQFAQQVATSFNPNLMCLNNEVSQLNPWPARLKFAEPAPMPIRCDVNPRLSAFLVVLDHSFAAVSDEQGNLLIEDIPTGLSLTFRAWHEAGKIVEVKVGGEKTTWSRGRFKVDLKPGVNDLGEVAIPVR
jgi:hypothetical protein